MGGLEEVNVEELYNFVGKLYAGQLASIPYGDTCPILSANSYDTFRDL